MKRILFILLTCIMCAPLFAQKGQAELAVMVENYLLRR